jgi:hypothetical protein
MKIKKKYNFGLRIYLPIQIQLLEIENPKGLPFWGGLLMVSEE